MDLPADRDMEICRRAFNDQHSVHLRVSPIHASKQDSITGQAPAMSSVPQEHGYLIRRVLSAFGPSIGRPSQVPAVSVFLPDDPCDLDPLGLRLRLALGGGRIRRQSR